MTPFRDVNADSLQRRIADDLYQARLARGLDVGDAAQTLRIRPSYLAALEEGRFADLPGPTYVAGFLRTYGNFLGLDGDELVRRYKDEIGGGLVRQQLNFPIAASEARHPTRWVILAAVVIAALIAGVWYLIQDHNLSSVNLVPAVPTQIAHDASHAGSSDVVATGGGDTVDVGATGAASGAKTTSSAAATPSSASTAATASAAPSGGNSSVAATAPATATSGSGQVATAPAAGTGSTHSSSTSTGGTTSAPATAASSTVTSSTQAGSAQQASAAQTNAGTAATTGAGTASGTNQGASSATTTSDSLAATDAAMSNGTGYVPRVYGRTNVGSRVEIRATQETWIQVEAPNNQILLTRVLLPGDIYRVPNRKDVTLDTGNAGGLEIRVDGKLIPPLGNAGVVVRHVSLAPKALLNR